MAYGVCRDCHQPISWDEQKRKQYNTRRPLNLDGTIHSCSGTEVQQQHFTPSPNPAQKVVTNGQDQKSLDIKAAQIQRKKEHDELITELRNLRKTIIAEIASRKGAEAQDIIDSIGFEQSREEERSFEDDVV